MKWLFVDVIPLYGVSPPARGAWIEIVADGGKNILPPESPPARGAWIEMLASVAISMILLSPPARGAWIEMA